MRGKRARCPHCRTAVLVPAVIPAHALPSRPADDPPSPSEAVTVAPSDSNQPGVRFRNIKVTAPDGKLLWEGVPELDALER